MVTRFKSPYTQSVTESEVFKRVTNQEKPIDELIDTVKELKSFGQSAIDTNIQTLQDENGENPTEEYVTSRKWGLQGKSPVRKTYLNTGKVCVYWRPSFLENK